MINCTRHGKKEVQNQQVKTEINNQCGVSLSIICTSSNENSRRGCIEGDTAIPCNHCETNPQASRLDSLSAPSFNFCYKNPFVNPKIVIRFNHCGPRVDSATNNIYLNFKFSLNGVNTYSFGAL